MTAHQVSSPVRDAFLCRHARHATRLRVIHGDGRVLVEGEVDSFYWKQMVLRDAVNVWGMAVRANITVRRPERRFGLTGPRVLLATAEPLTLACCAGELNRRGCDVTAADSGLGCVRSLRAGGYQVLVLVGDLPWGGSDGVLAAASAAGHLDRMRVICVGDRTWLAGLPPEVTGRLTHLTATTPTIAEVVARAVAGAG